MVSERSREQIRSCSFPNKKSPKTNLRNETRKKREVAQKIDSGRKLVRLHRESQRRNSISHHDGCVFKSVVSTPGARYLLAEIKHFYLNNILPDSEFMRIPLKIIPQEISHTYDLKALVDDQGWN